MAQGSTRVSQLLTNISIKYSNNEYIAGKFLKDVPVVKDSDSYFVYANAFKLAETRRANKTPANQVTWEVSTSSYKVVRHALKDGISQDDRDNTDLPLNLDIDSTEYLTDQLLLRQEYDAARLCFTTTTWSNNATLTTATSFVYNTTTSAPIQSILSATTVIIQAGKMPNTIIMGRAVLDALKENPNVYGRIQYVEKALITEQILASLFDVGSLYVGSAVIDTGNEGATASNGFVWGSDVLVAYFDPSPSLKKVTAACNFRSKSYGFPFATKKYRDENSDCDWIEVETKYEARAVATSCAYLLKTVTLV